MPSPRQPRRGQVQPATVAVLGAAALIVLGAALLAQRPGPFSVPAASARPSAPIATPVPSKAPSAPAATPSPATMTIPIDLRNASGHDVTLLVHGDLDAIASAVSGTPGDGMTVRWGKAWVENVDDRTIRVVWSGLPGDDTIDLDLSVRDGAADLTIVQPGPYAGTDAMGEDRVLVLTFDEPIQAENVEVAILNRTAD